LTLDSQSLRYVALRFVRHARQVTLLPSGSHELGDVPGPRIPLAPNAGRLLGAPEPALVALEFALGALEPALGALAPTLGALLPLERSVAGCAAGADVGREFTYVERSDVPAELLAVDRCVYRAATAGVSFAGFVLDCLLLTRCVRAGRAGVATVWCTACSSTNGLAAASNPDFNRSSGATPAAGPDG
jgi:hypothetical protein